MSGGIPREVLKWLLSLDLSYSVKNPKRDFANGFMYAEILSRYYPADIHMHSFENVASTERKKQNWALLEKVFRRKSMPIDKTQITAVMAAEGDASVEVLVAIHSFIHSPSYEATKEASSRVSSDRLEELAAPRDRGHEASTSQPDYIPAGYGYGGHGVLSVGHDGQAYQQQGPVPMYFGGGGYQAQQLQQMQPAMAVPYGYGHMQQQQQQVAGYAAQALQQQQQQQPPPQQQSVQAARQRASPHRNAVVPQRAAAAGQQQQQQPKAQGGYSAAYAATAYAEQMIQQAAAAGYTPEQQQLVYQQALYQHQQMAAQMADGSGAAADADVPLARVEIPYSKKPEHVEYKPYDMKDFENKDYNVKSGKAYWQLGRLGPDLETEELQAKREAKEKQKKLAQEVREENARRASSKPKQRPQAQQAPTARDRAREFAKNIPKPEPKPKREKTASSSGMDAGEEAGESELAQLERQHMERQHEVDRIRAELARVL